MTKLFRADTAAVLGVPTHLSFLILGEGGIFILDEEILAGL